MSAHVTYHVQVSLAPTTSVQEVSKVFEGLFRLQGRGMARVTIRPIHERLHPRVVRLCVDGADIAVDLADQRTISSESVLNEVQFYFKRNVDSAHLGQLSPERRQKVRPFGLNNPTARRGTAVRMLVAGLRAGRATQFVADARQLLALPSPKMFERAPDEPAEPVVLFQTRVWPLDHDDPAVAQLNEERVALIRTLKRAFGERFIGGLIPDPLARERYPDLITALPFSMRAYPRLVGRALVTINSPGLYGSLGFKLAEYLAASRCIVSHRTDVHLPEALEARRHFLAFGNPDECAAACEVLLSDSRRAQDMRRENNAYYLRQAEPGAQTLELLRQASEA